MKPHQNILVIDDDPIARTIFLSYFASTGIEKTYEAENGLEALKIVQSMQGEFDLVICDLNMPEMDGFEFLQQLRDLSFNGELVIVSGEHVSILQSAEKLAGAYDLNVRAAVSKPLSKQMLDSTFKSETPCADTTPKADPIDQKSLQRNIKEHRVTAYYQPRADVKTGKIICAVALARCQDFNLGIVSADQFIPVAEETDLLGDLTGVVLTQVFNQFKAWNSRGILINFAVNVGHVQFVAEGFPLYLSKILHDFAIEPARLSIEIAEQAVYQDFTSVMAAAARLRMLGAKICISDFGKGTTDIARLKQIAFNELKINQDIVQNAVTDELKREILQSAPRLATLLGVRLIAAGVETQEQWDLIANSGVHEYQGYHLAKPMAATEFERWYLEKSAITRAHVELDQFIEEESTATHSRQEAV